MKRYLVTGVSVLAMAFAAAAPVKAADMEPLLYDWSGPYFGVKLGYGTGDSRWRNPAGATSGDFEVDGFLGGFMSGWNFQQGNWVFGIDQDSSFFSVDGATGGGFCGAGCETDLRALGTYRGRVGVAFDRFLLYGTGGLAVGQVEASGAAFGEDKEWHFGWTAGAGAEWAFSDGWHARIEYLYVDLGSENYGSLTGGPFNVSLEEMHVVRAGISMKTGFIWDAIVGN